LSDEEIEEIKLVAENLNKKEMKWQGVFQDVIVDVQVPVNTLPE
jgi:hypothetical protein